MPTSTDKMWVITRYSPLDAALGYVQTAHCLGVPFPSDFDILLNHMHDVGTALRREPVPLCLCHNDVVRRNFLDDGTVRLIDWEYAGMGDRLFDLAIVIMNHQFSPEQEWLLLDAYGALATPADVQRYGRMKLLYHFREAMWALVQLGVSSASFDFDFRWLAEDHLAGLRQLITEM